MFLILDRQMPTWEAVFIRCGRPDKIRKKQAKSYFAQSDEHINLQLFNGSLLEIT
jgi:hypothetical protein